MLGPGLNPLDETLLSPLEGAAEPTLLGDMLEIMLGTPLNCWLDKGEPVALGFTLETALGVAELDRLGTVAIEGISLSPRVGKSDPN